METKPTPVEWLVEQLRQLAHNPKTHLGMGDIRVTQGHIDELEEQAKQMGKQQIINAYYGQALSINITTAELYYYHTYVSQTT